MAGRRRTEPAEPQDGVVTALAARRGQVERVAVHLDGRRAFDLSSTVADRAGLRAGDLLTAERQQELLDEDAPYRARERALRLLGLRDRSRRELVTRLRQAGFEAGVVEQTMEWLVDLGYLDDRRFAAAYVAEKQRGGWGPRKIRAELAAKGVERSTVDEAVAALEDLDSPASAKGDAILEQTVRRRFGGQFATDPEGAERRLAGFLGRRGYDWDTIGRMVRTLRAEASSEAESPSIP
jgi:regulatory protein